MLAVFAALAFAAPPHSVGAPWSGHLENPVAMPLQGRHWRFTGTSQKRGTNYGTKDIVALLTRAADTVDHFVDTPPLVLGDIGAEHGGKLGHHKSHQAGRDVDVLFYVIDPHGKRQASRGFNDFDEAGECVPKSCRGWRYDLQGNWWLVRTLLWSKRPQVQYVFVADWLKRRLLDYARSRGELPEILRRAESVLVQPRNSSPHADHFHVRIYCSAADRAAGCVDGGPRWGWIR